MVTRGQLLERPVLVPVGELCLDGIYLRGKSPGLLIASPVPGRGGSMANPVGSELAYAAAYSGAASLRLDYRGVGASEGDVSEALEVLTADLAGGLEFVIESAGGGAVVAGVYSGAWPTMLLASRDARVEGVLLICPDRRDPPAGCPDYGDLDVPVTIVQAGDDPGFNYGFEAELADAAMNARLHVIPGCERSFRSGLAKLARMVPPLLGRDLPE